MNAAYFETWLLNPAREPLMMGVLNVTPDSFSDGGQFATVESAVAHAEQMAAEGADIIDIGGESTRPGSLPVEPAKQIRRVIPVLQACAHRLPVVFSIDTRSSEVVSAALDSGVTLINDISAGRDDPKMLETAARQGTPIILMHMLAAPVSMQKAPKYKNVCSEVEHFLRDRISAAESAGVHRHRILIDPGIGFGKTLRHNLQLLQNLSSIRQLKTPMLVGTSRKRFLGEILNEPEPAKRTFGTAASVAWALSNGADIVRVHDVMPMRQVADVIRAIRAAST